MNTNYQAMHETVVRDIVEIIKDTKDAGKEGIDGIANLRRSCNNKYQKSINSATSDMVLVFPVICSRGVQLDNAAMVSKAIERQCVNLLQILFSASQITNVEDAHEYIKQFHTNLPSSGLSVDSFIGAMDDIASAIKEAGGIVDIGRIEAIKADLRENCNYVLPSNTSEHSLNEFAVYPANGIYRSNRVMMEANHDLEDELKQAQIDKAATGSMKDLTGAAKDTMDTLKSSNDILRNRLIDSDVKKANELQPTLMTINFIYKGENGEKPIVVNNILIGVKAKLYPVNSEDVASRIKLKTSDRNGLLNLVKATTRETSFWKDFVFAIDNAKIDALSTSRKGSSSKLWKILDRRSLKSKLRRSTGHNNDASAISTLVITQEEVDYIRRMETIDLENVSICRGLMESMNLMGIVIVDEVLEVAKFLWDTGDDMFENVSFTHLEREASDNSYKKVVNLMTKIVK